jgi:hypothetical protein
MDKLHQEINDIRDSMQSASKPCDPSLLLSLSPDDEKPTTSTVSSKPSYAGVVHQVVHDYVKKAVADSMKLQDNLVRDKSSVTLYNLPEKHQDRRDVMAVLSAISVSCVPNAGIRLGRLPTDSASSRPRPLKVTFSSISDRNMVLHAAAKLKGHALYGAVRISRFRLPDEMSKIRQLRADCKEMNDAAAVSDATNRPYFVINLDIMKKEASGKYVKVKGLTRKPASTAEGSSAKTARAGAKWLPLICQRRLTTTQQLCCCCFALSYNSLPVSQLCSIC